MIFFTLITYLAFLVQLSFGTISIAAGLYYLAELVEEYTVITKKIVWWMNTCTLGLFLCFWMFENLTLTMTICGVAAQISHFMILQNFPYVSFKSPAFLTATTLIVINHYLAFDYFTSVYHTFSEVMAYFTLCLWLVPFSLFVSLSANENVLPTTSERYDGDVVTNYFSKRGKKYGLLSFFNYAKESMLPHRTKKAF